LSFLCHLQLFLVSLQLIQSVLLCLQLFQSVIFCSVLVNSMNFPQSSVHCSVVSVIQSVLFQSYLLSHSFRRGGPLCVGLFCFSHIQSILFQSYLLSHPSQSFFYSQSYFFSLFHIYSLICSVFFLLVIFSLFQSRPSTLHLYLFILIYFLSLLFICCSMWFLVISLQLSLFDSSVIRIQARVFSLQHS
jgi:hypothetical protein